MTSCHFNVNAIAINKSFLIILFYDLKRRQEIGRKFCRTHHNMGIMKPWMKRVSSPAKHSRINSVLSCCGIKNTNIYLNYDLRWVLPGMRPCYACYYYSVGSSAHTAPLPEIHYLVNTVACTGAHQTPSSFAKPRALLSNYTPLNRAVDANRM